MYVASTYTETKHEMPHFPALQETASCDVVVIGAGITGISAALTLAEKGYQVRVLEAEQIAWGASGRSGGQIIAGVGDDAGAMIDMLGRDDAARAFAYSVEAMTLLKQRISDYNIACDLQLGQLEVAAKPAHVAHLEAMATLYRRAFQYELQWKSADDIEAMITSSAYYGGCYDPNGGHIHPLNYTLGLARAAVDKGVIFHENSAVTSIKEHAKPYVLTAQGRLNCEYIVVAANAYIDTLLPQLAKYILPVGTYICATEPLNQHILPANPAVVDTRHLLSYFRKDAQGRLLWGGRTGLTRHQPANLQRVLMKRILHAYPQLKGVKIEHVWGGNIAVTMNRMPQFGRVGRQVFYVHGYSGHGIAMANMGGLVIAEAIAGTAERLDLFERIQHRTYPGGTSLRAPGLACAMVYFYLRDKLG